jgi:hypothetical protein
MKRLGDFLSACRFKPRWRFATKFQTPPLTLERWEAAIAPGDADDVVCNVRIVPSLARMDEVSILRKDFLRLANNKEWLSDAVRIQCMVNIYLFD